MARPRSAVRSIPPPPKFREQRLRHRRGPVARGKCPSRHARSTIYGQILECLRHQNRLCVTTLWHESPYGTAVQAIA